MTDLEAKISSEFASGDPTVQPVGDMTRRPIVLRVSPRRIILATAVMLLMAGGVITYFAGNNTKSRQTNNPVATSPKPAETVQAATTSTPNTNTPTQNPVAKAARKTTAKPTAVAPVANKPTVPVATPAPTVAKPEPNLSVVDKLTTSTLRLVSNLVSTSLNIVL